MIEKLPEWALQLIEDVKMEMQVGSLQKVDGYERLKSTT